MPIATGSQSDLGYAKETVSGTPEGTSGSPVVYTAMRRKSAAGLNLTTDSYDSEEIRTDRMLIDSRHGTRRAGGDVETELSEGSFDDLFPALMGQADWYIPSATSTASITIVGSPTNSYTRSTGNFITDGFLVGDRVTVSGAVLAANNSPATILSMSTDGLSLVVDNDLVTAGAASVTVATNCMRLSVGSAYTSLTFERAYRDLSPARYQHFSGMRVNSFAAALPPTGIATATWNFLGKDVQPLSTDTRNSAGSPAGTGYASKSDKPVFAAVSGMLAISDATNGVRKLAVVTDLSFTIDNQLGGAELIGRKTLRDNLWGATQLISGKLAVLFEDEKLYNLFEKETEAALVLRLDGPGAPPSGYLSFLFPRCKFNSGSIGDAVATGLPVEMEFRALLPRSNAGGILLSQVVITTNSTGVDTAPDAFSWTTLTSQTAGSVSTSAAITITGFNTATAVTATGGSTFSINGGSFVSSGTISSGQTLAVRHTNSGSASTTTTTTVTIGGVSGTFSSVTSAGGGAVRFDSGTTQFDSGTTRWDNG